MSINSKKQWRYIPFGKFSGPKNMAIDETLLNSVIAGKSLNTIRFYQWIPTTASIGMHQSYSAEIDENAAKSQNIDIVRRISGGGAVLHESLGEITYAVICRLEDLPKIEKPQHIFDDSISKRYKVILEALACGIEKLGMAINIGKIHCPALFTDGKKISGNAQIIRKNVLLQHGTILLKVFPERMYEILRAPEGKSYTYMVNSVRSKVTGIMQQSKDLEFNYGDIVSVMKTGFEEVFNIALEKVPFSPEEEAEIDSLSKNKYENEKWLKKYV
ncbi:biotin/lipoate A/B protein ligase family protein [Promethearchaeum syntrophicum]|uniref:Biotin/lipoate A/B protein ligase family protein n=1 Tax=Promethearchaeum syntrophicum TaxID=2594042 RepID=A0A5B9DBV1_9ARCH